MGLPYSPGARRTATLLVALLIFAGFCHGAVFAAEPAATGRHVILAFDDSTSMAPHSRAEQKTLDSLKKYLLEILYSRVPDTAINLDIRYPESNGKTNLECDKPLYREGDKLTYYTFGADINYRFARQNTFIDAKALSAKFPAQFAAEWSFVRCAKAEGFQNYQPRRDPDGTYFILVTDEEEDFPNNNWNRFRDCDARFSAFEMDHQFKVEFAMKVGGRYWIKLYKIEGPSAASPFLLTTAGDGKPVHGLTFSSQGSSPQYKLFQNNSVLRDYRITDLKAVVRPLDSDKIEQEVTLLKKTSPLPLTFGPIVIDKKYATDQYQVDLEVGFEPKDRAKRTDGAYYVYRRLSTGSEDLKPQVTAVLETPATEITLKPEGEDLTGSLPLSLKAGINADALTINSLALVDQMGAVIVDLKPRTKLNFPATLPISIPKGKLDGKQAAIKLAGRYNNANINQSFPVKVETPAPPLTFSLPCGGDKDVLRFTKEGDALFLNCQLDVQGISPSDIRITTADLNIGGQPLSLGPLVVGVPFKISLTKDQWEQIWAVRNEPSKLVLAYKTPLDPAGQASLTFSQVVTPPVAADCRPAYVLTDTPNGVTTTTAVQSQWTAKGLQISDLYVNPDPALPADYLKCVEKTTYKVEGLASAEGEVTQFPLKLTLAVASPEAEKLTPGTQPLKVIVIPQGTGEIPQQAFDAQVTIPKPQAPQFVVATRENEKAAAAEIKAERTDAGLVLRNVVLKATKPNGLKSIDKAQLLSGGAVLYEWPKTKIPSTGYLSDAILKSDKLTERETPVAIKVFYTQMGREGQGTAQVNTTLVTPCGWPYPLSGLEGILPCFPWWLLLVVPLALLLLIGGLIYFLVCKKRGKKPIWVKVTLTGPPEGDLNGQTSPAFELNAGDKLYLGANPSAMKLWEVPQGPNNFLACEKGRCGKKILYLRSMQSMSKTKVEAGKDYEIETLSDQQPLYIRVLFFETRPPVVEEGPQKAPDDDDIELN